MKNRSIFSVTFKELEQFLIESNKKKYIVKQIFHWLYKQFDSSYDEMTNISKENIIFLKEKFYFDTLKVSKTQIDKGTKLERFFLN